MSLRLIYITNSPRIAVIAEKYGVDSIMVDLETIGKEERQKNMNTVKSHHDLGDVEAVSKSLTKSELIVRVNPWNDGSKAEIDAVIAAGANRVMLPMWKTVSEVESFLDYVNGRAKTMLLLETKEAVEIVDEILELPSVDEIYIGLNDLHISYGLDFMFEPLSNGIVEGLCHKLRSKKIRYGFGGVARIGEGMLPAERVVMEHYRLGSTSVILSRSFCDAAKIENVLEVERIFSENLGLLRNYEDSIKEKCALDYEINRREVISCVQKIVDTIKEKKCNG